MSVVCDPRHIRISETNLPTPTMYDVFAKIVIALGVFLILIGVIVLFLGKVGLLGKLPGDIGIEKNNLQFHFPLATCIVASVILSLLLSAFFLWFKK